MVNINKRFSSQTSKILSQKTLTVPEEIFTNILKNVSVQELRKNFDSISNEILLQVQSSLLDDNLKKQYVQRLKQIQAEKDPTRLTLYLMQQARGI